MVASKRFGRLCLRIEPRPQNETAGCTFCRNLMSAPQPVKVGTTPLIFNIKKAKIMKNAIFEMISPFCGGLHFEYV